MEEGRKVTSINRSMVVRAFVADMEVELSKAESKFPGGFHSLHEAYAVLAEEVDEVWDICRQKDDRRDRWKLRGELVQVATMALRAVLELKL